MIPERVRKLRALVNPAGFGLEIGPSHSPVFPKSEGFNVEILDYADQAALTEKYRNAGVDVAAIEPVDYVSAGGALHDVVPRRGEYDFIFSSHAIEHVTDFVGYLRSCELLLKPDGVIVLAVPDKRYTFDLLQPLTTTGRVLEAHHRGQARHSPAAAFDFFANFVRMDGQETWLNSASGTLAFVNALETGVPVLHDALRPDGPYHDVHGWIFTPNSFRLILHDLKALGLVEVDECHLHEEVALEFHVALRRGAAGHGLDRMTLQKRIAREQLISSLQILAPDDPRLAALFAELREPVASAAPAPPERRGFWKGWRPHG